MVCIAVGAVTTLIAAVPVALQLAQTGYARLWRRFAVWLALSLEFALAADIADTVIAPSWDAIGQLAAFAAARTVLNRPLERDLDFIELFLPRRLRNKGPKGEAEA